MRNKSINELTIFFHFDHEVLLPQGRQSRDQNVLPSRHHRGLINNNLSNHVENVDLKIKLCFTHESRGTSKTLDMFLVVETASKLAQR